LDVIRDWWSLLIIRNAMVGTFRFNTFQKNLGIAQNMLAARLRTLVANGILDVVAAPNGEAHPGVGTLRRPTADDMMSLHFFGPGPPPMPHKHNVARRHHIPKMSFKVQNWPAYDAGLRRRGSLTLWIEDRALEDWQTCGQGGQARYTDAAIPDVAHCVQTAVAADRRPDGIGLQGDGSDNLGA
jgi:HxlR-like helix-turn-helix